MNPYVAESLAGGALTLLTRVSARIRGELSKKVVEARRVTA